MMQHYLHASFFVNSDHAQIQEMAQDLTQGLVDDREKALALYYPVRDMFRYNPYRISFEPLHSVASEILLRDSKEGHCIDKAIVLAALGRAVGIPTRLHFANVRNHIGTEKLEEMLGTDVLVFHGFMEFFLHGKWVKCTPAFNKELCDKLNVAPLDFDGKNDSVLQEYDHSGGKFMEYLYDHGCFHDFPLDMFRRQLGLSYPKLMELLDLSS